MTARVDVLGVGVSITSTERALTEIAGWIARGEQNYVCVTGVHGVMESQRDPDLLEIHNASGLTLPDGAPLLWAGRMAGAHEMQRVRGPSFMPALCEEAAARGWRSYFYGGGPGTAEALALQLQRRWPGFLVAGIESPPFRDLTAEEEAKVVGRINASGADIVWVGLSTPKQERWMSSMMGRVDPPVLIGVGRAFDITAGVARQAPEWLWPTGLEWCYRLFQEPRRLWRRYLHNNPRFIAQIMRSPPQIRAEVPVAERAAEPVAWESS